MKPEELKTKIFLDSGDPEETKEIIELLGFLDGQTTNPSLIAKSPEAKARLDAGNKFTSEEVNEFYKKIVSVVSDLIPEGSVSIEVFADANTTADEMLTQARAMNTWIPNAHIKYPTTKGGLDAANKSIAEGMSVNMTLVFSEAQAAAVYSATKGAKKGQVFLSPFIGRLDDRGENGMDFIKNVCELYKSGDGHVELLAASVRSMDHFLACLHLEVDIITAPFKILKSWAESGMALPPKDYNYLPGSLLEIPKQTVNLEGEYSSYDIKHPLTDQGIEKFVQDWKSIIV